MATPPERHRALLAKQQELSQTQAEFLADIPPGSARLGWENGGARIYARDSGGKVKIYTLLDEVGERPAS